ncbi:MAG TPA: fasciclin domain-containing protein [Roseomonas sp.]|nr:fasciclin domain-containing protein [Roseomonas sp.]
MLHRKSSRIEADAISRRSFGVAAAGAALAPAVLSLRSTPAVAQSRSALDLIGSARYVSIFAQVVKNHNLEEEFSAPGEFGFFIPLNAAVERVPALVVERFRRDKEYARQIVLNHITDYSGMISNVFAQQGSSTDFVQVKTKAGFTLTLEMGSGLPRLAGYPITYTNIRASNGYCHALDGVLLV